MEQSSLTCVSGVSDSHSMWLTLSHSHNHSSMHTHMYTDPRHSGVVQEERNRLGACRVNNPHIHSHAHKTKDSYHSVCAVGAKSCPIESTSLSKPCSKRPLSLSLRTSAIV